MNASTPTCTCGKPTRDAAYFCETCGDDMAKALGDAGWLDDELEITITGQRGIPTEGGPANAERGLPWHEAASNARRALRNTLVGWVRICDEEAVRHREPTNDLPPADTIAAISRWLLWRVDGLASGGSDRAQQHAVSRVPGDQGGTSEPQGDPMNENHSGEQVVPNFVPVLVSTPVSKIVMFWRVGSYEHSWAEEYDDLMHGDRSGVTKKILARVDSEGIEFADEITPVLLGSDGRVWDGHHRICIAVKRGIQYLMCEYADGIEMVDGDPRFRDVNPPTA